MSVYAVESSRETHTEVHDVHMSVKRTTPAFDEPATAEQGPRLLAAQQHRTEERRDDALERHLANAAAAVDFDVLVSGEVWR